MNQDSRRGRELILISGVEGGGVTLYGERTECGWRFYSNFVDQTPFMLDDEEDQREIRRESRKVESWEEALELLDQMGWLRLPAVMVHREFRQKVWEAVQSRLGWEGENVAKLERWRERCKINVN
jgi:hypothetical protein